MPARLAEEANLGPHQPESLGPPSRSSINGILKESGRKFKNVPACLYP